MGEERRLLRTSLGIFVLQQDCEGEMALLSAVQRFAFERMLSPGLRE